jgi:hypothetical protein
MVSGQEKEFRNPIWDPVATGRWLACTTKFDRRVVMQITASTSQGSDIADFAAAA